MRDEWPQEKVAVEVDRIIGNSQGHSGLPKGRLKDAHPLWVALIDHLNLVADSELIDVEFINEILQTVCETFSDNRDIRASAELLGFNKNTANELNAIFQHAGAWLSDEAKKLGYESVHCRRYLATLHLRFPCADRKKARGKQVNVWTPAMSRAIQSFLDDHRDTAISIAAKHGLYPRTEEVSATRPFVKPSYGDSSSPSARREIIRRAPGGQLAPRQWRDRMPYASKDFINRDQLHDQIMQYVDTDNYRIALVGLLGFGKTHLASISSVKIAEALGGEALHLDGGTRESLFVDMHSELLARGKQVELYESTLIREFAALLNTWHRPIVVLVDDVTDPSLLKRVLPSYLRAPVIATMKEMRLDKQVWQYVSVEELSGAESFDFARRELLESFTDADVRMLAGALHGYPIAILYAGVLLNQSVFLTVADFCFSLGQDVPRTIGDAKDRNDQTLIFIYKALLDRLTQDSLHAAQVLVVVAMLKRPTVPYDVLLRIFELIAPVVEDAPPYSYDKPGLARAILKLQDFALISPSDGSTELRLHQLVRELVLDSGHRQHPDMSIVVATFFRDHLRQSSESIEVHIWAETISALVESVAARPDLYSQQFSLFEDLLVAALRLASRHDEEQALEVLRDNSFFARWSSEGREDGHTTYRQYQLLSTSEHDYDPLSLISLSPSRYIGSKTDYTRQCATLNQQWGTGAVARDTLGLTINLGGGVRRLEPNSDDKVLLICDRMRNGDLKLVYAPAMDVAQTSDSPRDRVRARALLAEFALRGRNLENAQYQVQELRRSYSAFGVDRTTLPNDGYVDLLEGDLIFARSVLSDETNGLMEATEKLYRRARQRFNLELVPISLSEAKRRLLLVQALTDTTGALSGLRTLSQQTRVPLLLSVHFRVAVSLAKVAVLSSSITNEIVDECWRAAEFFSTSQAFDRYWYAETLRVLYLACRQQSDNFHVDFFGETLLTTTMKRELAVVGRADKADFAVMAARREKLYLDQLIID